MQLVSPCWVGLQAVQHRTCSLMGYEDTLATCENTSVMTYALPMDEMLRVEAEIDAGWYTFNW